MDNTQLIVKNRLGLTEMQIEAFKNIYDFISRFAGVQQANWNQDITLYSVFDLKIQSRKGGTLHRVPKKTFEIISAIGTEELYKHFSPHAYPTKFETFCKKLMASGKVVMSDYVIDGLIVFDKVKVEVEEYEYQDDGLFGLREAS